jgi:hypothetical protein
MANPMSNYSSDAKEFLSDYRKTASKSYEDHQDIVKEFGENYERAYQQLNTYYAEAYRDLSYSLGNQWSLEEISYLNNQRRSSFTYNMCRRMVNLIEGIQRSNRLATKIMPIEDAADLTAEIMTDTMQYIMTSGMGYDRISKAFRDSLITGISWLCPYIDYREDPVNGDIKFHVDDWNNTIWDPFFTQKDMSDCSFWSRRKYLDRTTVISLIPDQQDRINALPYGSRDDKFTYMSFARQWGMQKLLNYTEYWRRRWEIKDVLVDMRTGETTVWKGPKERLKFMRNIAPNLQIMKKPVRTVELGIIVEGELLYYGKDPYGLDDYPCVPIFGGDYAPSYDLFTWKLQGIVRYIRDPQTELNKRISRHVDLLDSQLNSGWIAKTGAVTNNSSLFKSGNGQVIFLKPEAQMTDVQRIEAPDIPQGQMLLTEMFDKIIPNILGINPEMLGMPENEKVETAAVLAKMRQASGLISLRGVFDNLAESQKILGQKVMKLIQVNYSPEKIQLITKKEPTPEFYSKMFARYDVVVEEGLLTDTQRQSQFMDLLLLKQMGVVGDEVNPLIIKASNLHGKAELNELIEAKQKAESEQLQKQEQLQNQQMAVMTDGIEAKAKSDQALAMERMNKIHLDEAISAERVQRAQQESTAQMLDFAKILKELQGLDLNQIQQKVAMLKGLHDIEQGLHSREMDHHNLGIEHRKLDLQQEQAQQQAQMASAASQTP